MAFVALLGFLRSLGNEDKAYNALKKRGMSDKTARKVAKAAYRGRLFGSSKSKREKRKSKKWVINF